MIDLRRVDELDSSMLPFAPYTFIQLVNDEYFLNYWIKIPDGFIVESTVPAPVDSAGVKVYTVTVVKAHHAPGSIEKCAELLIDTNNEQIDKVKVVCQYPDDGASLMRSTTLKLDQVKPSDIGSRFSNGILSLSPYGYFEKEDSEDDEYTFRYLVMTENERRLSPIYGMTSEGTVYILPIHFDVIRKQGEESYFIGKEGGIPGMNLKDEPYLYFDSYVSTLEVDAQGSPITLQPRTRNSIILLYEDAD